MGTLGEQVSSMEQMDKLVTLCKRRGFVFANSEIYSGLAGFWDYGPLGVELKRNIQRFWWDSVVRRRDNVVGLDSAAIGPEAVWVASGHVAAFNDALVDDKNTKERFRIDQLAYLSEEDAEAAEIYALEWMENHPQKRIEAIQPPGWGSWLVAEDGNPDKVLRDRDEFGDGVVQEFITKQDAEAKIGTLRARFESSFWDGLNELLGYYPLNPNTKKESRFTAPRRFNLMFKQNIGATGEASQVGYLRAETCQPIFVDFDQVRVSARQKVPFGIAQIGPAFRNEINPRNFLFRAREFSQMEMEFFVRPDALQEQLRGAQASDEPGLHDQPGSLASTMDWYDYWLGERRAYYTALGIRDELLRIHDHPPEKLAHYAQAACDIEFLFPFGWGELEGVHHRGEYDLRQHQQHSGKKLEYYDDEAQRILVDARLGKDEARQAATYLPNCIETSVGLDRTFLAVLTAAYDEDIQETKHENKADDIRIVLRLHPRLAPVTCAVFPLSKKLSGPDSAAYRLHRELIEAGLVSEYDDTGSIGKRYRRMDEVGTPWCLTYDFDSESDGAVTIRDRDSLAQDRVALGEVVDVIHQRLRER